ncbi:MAG: hypothetical protein CMI00_10310 [Oceanospirillaceae bacterium]|nr:hypothetical protein [Oceanospirillaceae bacterium]|tara:strand:+ start:124 stop:2163 length:2040 start_codon:yes stop_codon:yes gene_type:complete
MMTVDGFSELKVKNLTFMKHYFPAIYAVLNDYTPEEKQLNLDTESSRLQLINRLTGQVLISDAEAEAREEVSQFINNCQRNNRLITVGTAFGNTFTIPRFSAKKLAELTEKSPLQQKNFDFYPFDNHIPLLCVMGVGLGLQIRELMSSLTIDHLIICERDIDELYASLFTTDWAECCEHLINDPHKSFTFVLVPKADEELAYALLWNHLVKQPPFFPTGTVFYNHRSNNRHERILARIRKDITMFYSLWGNYDDEINQLNNALHNFRLGVKRLRLPLTEHTGTPVLIIGSGPSLDERLDWIKSVQDKCVVVSCGSARDVLRRNGIQPDFQVELESDYVAAEAYARSMSGEDTRGTTLLAAAQVPPKIFEIYESKQAFFKDSTAMASLFSQNNVVPGCTPSATNAGLGVFLHLGFKNVFLFGMDFGYIDPLKHHSKDSIYYTDESPEDLIDSTWDNLEEGMPVECVDGSTIKTIPFLFTGMRRAEVEIAQFLNSRELSVYNCSLGAKISRTEWLNDVENFERIIAACGGDRTLTVGAVNEPGDVITEDEIAERLNLLEDAIRRVCLRSLDELSHLEYNLESISDCTYRIARFLEEDIYINLKTIYYLFRGTMWFFLSIGYSHAYALSEEERPEFIATWKRIFSAFLDEWPGHYRSVVHRQLAPEDDPMLTKKITEAVEGF